MQIEKEIVMFELNQYQKLLFQSNRNSANLHQYRYAVAIEMFRQSIFSGKFAHLKRWVLRKRRDLYDIASIKKSVCLRGLYYSGIRVVDIQDIIGTEGRVTDFDIEFNPVNESDRKRWVNMALAYLSHIPLPPVELIQIGDAYFVRDGHHRISVARALGQTAVDAEVIVWKSCPPYPWQSSVGFRPVHLTS
jgi:hypothetical protein